LLSELGSNAPSEILLRDGLGRNCIHTAAMGAGAASDSILLELMGCFARHAVLLLKRDMQALEKVSQ
jgi:hypothetical protein